MHDLTREELIALVIKQSVEIGELRRRALFEPLTSLWRRWRGEDELDQLLQLAKRKSGQTYAVLFLDIDHFKQFNDTYDHATGDHVLQLVSAVILDEMRSTDSGVRWGGEELLVICPNTTQAEGLQLAERIRRRVGGIDTGVEHGVTVSIGVSDNSSHDELSDAIVGRADIAMYAAKHAGRNQVAQLFSEVA